MTVGTQFSFPFLEHKEDLTLHLLTILVTLGGLSDPHPLIGQKLQVIAHATQFPFSHTN